MSRRRRRFTTALPFAPLLLLGFALHATTAYSAPGDPPVGSPSGSVYVLPLEQGRADAAPKGDGGITTPGAGTARSGSGGGSGQGDAGSLYRSENNFGSSSQVPGLAAAGFGGGGGSSGGGSGVPGGGVGGAAGGGAVAGAGIAAAEVSDVGNTSPAAGIALLVGIGGVAAAIGVLSRRKRT